MPLFRLIATLFILLVFAKVSSSQEQPRPVLVDEFGKICSEELMARYDHYMAAIYNNPTSTSQIIFYGNDSTEGSNLTFIQFIMGTYPNFRGFDKSRLHLVRGKNRPEMKVQFWLVPAGAEAPLPAESFRSEDITSTTMFDSVWADFYRIAGEKAIYSDALNNDCDFGPNKTEFAKKLKANPTVTGYLVLYTEFGKGKRHADSVARFAMKEFVKQYNVNRKQLITVYGGNRNQPEIEFWFVPQGSQTPFLKPDIKKVQN